MQIVHVVSHAQEDGRVAWGVEVHRGLGASERGSSVELAHGGIIVGRVACADDGIVVDGRRVHCWLEVPDYCDLRCS